jgi:hypothetical protein
VFISLMPKTKHKVCYNCTVRNLCELHHKVEISIWSTVELPDFNKGSHQCPESVVIHKKHQILFLHCNNHNKVSLSLTSVVTWLINLVKGLLVLVSNLSSEISYAK